MWSHDLQFWLAVAGAVVVKLITSEFAGITRAAITVTAAVFSAWVFTNPILDFLDLNPETYQIPVAALAALTGEGFIKMVIRVTAEPQSLLDFIRAWRGGK